MCRAPSLKGILQRFQQFYARLHVLRVLRYSCFTQVSRFPHVLVIPVSAVIIESGRLKL